MHPTKIITTCATILFLTASCGKSPFPESTATCDVNGEHSLRAIAGMASDIFIGKIGDKIQSYNAVTGPVDVYAADASHPIAGTAQGAVEVGFSRFGNIGTDLGSCQYRDQVPRTGQTYLLATKYDAAKRIFVTPLFRQAITELTAQDVQKVGTPNEPAIVQQMREAAKSPLPPPIYSTTTDRYIDAK